MPRRFLVLVATLLSLPMAGFAAAAFVSIALSLSTEDWYRRAFAGYGATLLVEYGLFVAGLVAIAALAARRPPLPARGARVARIVAAAGVLAAIAIEITFHDDLSKHLLHGIVVLPFALWGLACRLGRARGPRPPA